MKDLKLIWFETIEGIFEVNSFFSTFAGPMNLFGIIERDLGFYDPIKINKTITTNIFTAFRGFVSDFSLIGSLIISFILGMYLQFVYQRKVDNCLSGIIPISIFYSFTLYSPLISIFHYNSIFFSWVLIFFILKMK